MINNNTFQFQPNNNTNTNNKTAEQKYLCAAKMAGN